MSLEADMKKLQLVAQQAQQTVVAYNSEDGRIVQTKFPVYIDTKGGRVPTTFDMQQWQSLGWEAMLQAAKRVDSWYVTTSYRNVLKREEWKVWRDMYMAAPVPQQYLYIEGVNPNPKAEPAIPCHYCGIVLPFDHITIDHQRPQTGGEAQAMLKLLHTLGMHFTHDPAKGTKGKLLMTGAAGQVPTRGQIPQRGERQMSYRKPHRYTLTSQGMIFLSVLIHVTPMAYANYGLHSLTNLVPSCFRCNGIKNDGRVDLEGINTGI